MSYEINPDQSYQFLLPPKLEDWVPHDHHVRFIREFVNSIDLNAIGFKERRIKNGRPNYGAKLLLSIWLYGLFEKIYSSRQLEKACRTHFPLVWLAGMETPDHNSLWRFFHAHHKLMKKIFKQTVKLAHNAGLVGLVRQAIDGTKIQSNVSRNKSLQLSDLKNLMSQLDEVMDTIYSEIKAQSKRESIEESARLPKELQNKKKLRKLIENGLKDLSYEECENLKLAVEKQVNEMETKEVKHMSLTDKEAVMVKDGRKGSKDFGYNAQCAVDSHSQIITGAKVVSSSVDNGCLNLMIEEAMVNTGDKCAETVVDGGYFSGKELEKAEDAGHSVVMKLQSSVKGENIRGKILEYHKRSFLYDQANDVYTCPHGNELSFERTKASKRRGYSTRLYRCKSWRSCEHSSKCSTDRRGRSIERAPFEEQIERQIEINNSPLGRKAQIARSAIVEPVFAWIKHHYGFRRWSYIGLDKVDAQWQLLCAAVNLRKLYAQWRVGKISFK